MFQIFNVAKKNVKLLSNALYTKQATINSAAAHYMYICNYIRIQLKLLI